jgi:hypothetical protein
VKRPAAAAARADAIDGIGEGFTVVAAIHIGLVVLAAVLTRVIARC